MGMDEAVVFVDAVHPTHQVHAAGCWAPKGIAIAVEQTTGRQPLNIHGAINLETGQTQMLEVAKVNARSLIALLKAVEIAHPQKRRIHVHLDNASYHHAKRVREWLKQQGRKCVLHFIRPIVPTSIRSSDAGASCISTRPTTETTKPSTNSARRS